MLQDKSFRLLMVCMSLVSISTCKAQDFYTQKPRGFLWYTDEPRKEKAPRDTSLTPVQKKALSREEVARQRNEALKQKLDGSIQVVLDNPTIDNAIRAQRMQKLVMDRSTEFSKVWRLAALVDAGLIKPEMNPNVLHQEISKKDKRNQDLMALKKMTQEWGLFLYVMDHCKYCMKFAPIVKEIQDETGFQVLAISQEGKNYGPLIGRKDTGILDHLNPEGFAPVLYLVHRDGKRIYPVARGLTDSGKVKENILLIKNMDSQRGAG